MADTRSRPRTGSQQISRVPLSAMFYDNWAACPHELHKGDPSGIPSERDGRVWEDYANASYRCRGGHVFTERTALWEVQER